MTVNKLLQLLDIMNQSSGARYPDGSGGRDEYTLYVHMHGHGKILDAKVLEASIGLNALYLFAVGKEEPQA